MSNTQAMQWRATEQWDRTSLSRPLVITAEALGMCTRPQIFDVVSAFEGPAITIVGDRKANGIGFMLPPIILNCGWYSGGIQFQRIDNAIIGGIKVYRAIDTAIDVATCRQSYFSSLQTTESISLKAGTPAIRIRSERQDKGDATNACRFDFVSVYACGNDTYMAVEGGGDPGGLGACRTNAFGSVFLHVLWERQLAELPDMAREYFQARARTMLRMNWVEDCTFANLVITSEPAIACETVQATRTQRCRFAGRILAAKDSRHTVDAKNAWYVTDLTRR